MPNILWQGGVGRLFGDPMSAELPCAGFPPSPPVLLHPALPHRCALHLCCRHPSLAFPTLRPPGPLPRPPAGACLQHRGRVHQRSRGAAAGVRRRRGRRRGTGVIPGKAIPFLDSSTSPQPLLSSVGSCCPAVPGSTAPLEGTPPPPPALPHSTVPDVLLFACDVLCMLCTHVCCAMIVR